MASATLSTKCFFSGYNIYPGTGIQYIRTDGKSYKFQSKKTKSFFLKKRNPRKITWTAAYRTVHKKGITAQAARKRARRTVKVDRAVVGASLEKIKALREQTADFRLAQREAAIREAKARKAAEAKKKADAKKKEAAAAAPKPVQAKVRGPSAKHAGKGR